VADHQPRHLGTCLCGDGLIVAPASGEGTAVSLTPVSLDRDSRAFRIARSLADLGFDSVVIEGRKSSCRFWGPEIEVKSAGPRQTAAPPGAEARTPVRGAVNALRDGRLGGIGELALYSGFRGYDWWRHCRQPAGLLPAARLYYLHSFELYRIVAPIAARLGAKVVYDAHDFYRGIEPGERQRSFDRNYLRPFLNRLEERLVATADAVVTVSNGVADLMAGVFSRQPIVIRNCHDERLDRSIAPDLRAMLGLPPGHKLCVVVGNWKPGMAIGAAVDALRRLPERFHLAFVGREYEKVADALPRSLLGNRLHIGHAVTPDEIVPTIRTADIGLVIYDAYSENYRWALPNGLFQLIAAGLPTVRGALPEIEGIIGGRQVGFCVPRLEPAELAEAIMHCAANAEELGRNTAALGRELRWQTEAKRLRELVEALVEKPSISKQVRAAFCDPMVSCQGD
jgi:glycosyltransferase involved in cell wall biosynthesis